MLGWCGTEGGASTVCNWRRASLTDSPQSCTAVITEQLVSSGLQQGFGAPSVAFPKSSCSRTFSFRSNKSLGWMLSAGDGSLLVTLKGSFVPQQSDAHTALSLLPARHFAGILYSENIPS
ncbi:hypothetical protein LUU34_00573100 [Aix galericulata]|nr:hypothetical protein LUU34_00573100 [Aix galericulata]